MQPYGMPPQAQGNALAIASIVLASAPIVLALLIVRLLVRFSAGGFFGDVGQAYWPLFLMAGIVVVIIGLIADVLAVIFGIMAIAKQTTLISFIGILIVAAKVLILKLI